MHRCKKIDKYQVCPKRGKTGVGSGYGGRFPSKPKSQPIFSFTNFPVFRMLLLLMVNAGGSYNC